MFLKNSDIDHFTDLMRAFRAIDPFSDLYTVESQLSEPRLSEQLSDFAWLTEHKPRPTTSCLQLVKWRLQKESEYFEYRQEIGCL